MTKLKPHPIPDAALDADCIPLDTELSFSAIICY